MAEGIKIHVEELTLDTVIGQRYDSETDRRCDQTLADAIVEVAARNLLNDADWLNVKERIRSLRDEEIRARVAVEVEAAMSGPVSITNIYGEATGRSTTLREEIAKLTAEALKMDHRNNYSRELTPAQRCIRDEVDRALAAELASVVKEEKEKVVAAVRAKAADLIAQAVKEGVGR